MSELMNDIGSYVQAAALAPPIVGILIWYNSSAVEKAQKSYLGQFALALENKLERKQFRIPEKRADRLFYMGDLEHLLNPTLYSVNAGAIEAFCQDKQCAVKPVRKSTPYLGVAQKMQRIVWASVNDKLQLVFPEHLPAMGNS